MSAPRHRSPPAGWALALLIGHLGTATAQAPYAPGAAEYVRWLEERSMLFQAGEQAKLISGRGVQWRHPYGEPQPLEGVRKASVSLLDYPGPGITRPRPAVIATSGAPR